ncbi:ankyrin repeat-containing domain protein [Trichophaea hybrida]|nr:ankyrin repeat-containing domain protein [Trichophaea hybrida]
MIRALLEKDVDLIKSTYMGYPPLHAAAIMATHLPLSYSYYYLSYKLRGCVETTVRLLLERGAEVEARDLTGKTALMLLVQQHSPDLNLLRLLLLDYGANVNASYSKDIAVLHEATIVGNPNVIRMLVKCGANVNAWSCMGGGSPFDWWWGINRETFISGSGVHGMADIFALLKQRTKMRIRMDLCLIRLVDTDLGGGGGGGGGTIRFLMDVV